jgi:hypothetical protein
MLAHSVSPHHHHEEQELSIDHDDDHHNSDDHGLFTYSQIENTFLTGKQVVVPIAFTTVIEIFEWSFVFRSEKEPDDYFIKDINIPPLLGCLDIPFRGPPSFS